MSPHLDPLTTAGWTLVSYRAGGHLTSARAREATLRFAADGTLAGSTGVNRFFGKWEGDAEGLSITVAGTTMMAGDDAAMAQERAVLDALAAVASWSAAGRSLVLSDTDGEALLTYTGESAEDLAGTSWSVVGVNNGRQAVVSSALTEALTLELDVDGRATGSSGCNRFTGPYALDGDRITFGPLAVTRKRCPDDEVMALEGQYLDALERSVGVQLEGDRLTFRDADGATQVTLHRA